MAEPVNSEVIYTARVNSIADKVIGLAGTDCMSNLSREIAVSGKVDREAPNQQMYWQVIEAQLRWELKFDSGATEADKKIYKDVEKNIEDSVLKHSEFSQLVKDIKETTQWSDLIEAGKKVRRADKDWDKNVEKANSKKAELLKTADEMLETKQSLKGGGYNDLLKQILEKSMLDEVSGKKEPVPDIKPVKPTGLRSEAEMVSLNKPEAGRS